MNQESDKSCVGVSCYG